MNWGYFQVEPDLELKRRAESITDRFSLSELRLHRITGELLYATPALDLVLSSKVRLTMTPLKGSVIYGVTYDFLARDAADIETARGSITLNMVFKLLDDKLTTEDLKAFAAYGVVSIAHPYIREKWHSLTSQMMLPPLLLEVMPPPAKVFGN